MYGNAPLIFVPLYCKKEHRQSVEKKNLAAITGNIFFKMINLFREIVKLFIRKRFQNRFHICSNFRETVINSV